MLQPHRDSHQTIGDPQITALRFRKPLVRGCGGMCHDRLGIAQIVGNDTHLDRIEEPERRRFAPFQIKRQHGAALAHLTGDQIVLGMPLGMGKPNPLANAMYRAASADPDLSLTILTALLISPHLKEEQLTDK